MAQDDEMLELLLLHGVDPNHGCSDPPETVYDLALFDYLFETWLKHWENPPELPDHIGLDDEDALLGFLSGVAEEEGRPCPRLPLLLRKYGALSGYELVRKLGGQSSDWVVWCDGAWRLRPKMERVKSAGFVP